MKGDDRLVELLADHPMRSCINPQDLYSKPERPIFKPPPTLLSLSNDLGRFKDPG
jgi:hypothetical protein